MALMDLHDAISPTAVDQDRHAPSLALLRVVVGVEPMASSGTGLAETGSLRPLLNAYNVPMHAVNGLQKKKLDGTQRRRP